MDRQRLEILKRRSLENMRKYIGKKDLYDFWRRAYLAFCMRIENLDIQGGVDG